MRGACIPRGEEGYVPLEGILQDLVSADTEHIVIFLPPFGMEHMRPDPHSPDPGGRIRGKPAAKMQADPPERNLDRMPVDHRCRSDVYR